MLGYGNVPVNTPDLPVHNIWHQNHPANEFMNHRHDKCWVENVIC